MLLKKLAKPKKVDVKQKRIALKELLAKKAASYEALDPHSLERNIGNESWRKRLINTLLTWASDESTVELTYFFRDYNILRDTMYDWMKKYPDVDEAYKMAKLLIAGNRRNGSIKKKFDHASSYRGIHRLDSEEKENDKYYAELKKTSGEGITGILCIDTSKPKVQSRDELIKEKSSDNITIHITNPNEAHDL